MAYNCLNNSRMLVFSPDSSGILPALAKQRGADIADGGTLRKGCANACAADRF